MKTPKLVTSRRESREGPQHLVLPVFALLVAFLEDHPMNKRKMFNPDPFNEEIETAKTMPEFMMGIVRLSLAIRKL